MVDGSIRGDRLRPLGLWWSAAGGRVSQSLREPAGRLAVILDGGAWRKRSARGGSADRLERAGPELAQGVERAPGELARDRHRRARVREAAGLEREVVGVV